VTLAVIPDQCKQDRGKPYPNAFNIGQVQFPKAGAVLACLGEARLEPPCAFKLKQISIQ